MKAAGTHCTNGRAPAHVGALFFCARQAWELNIAYGASTDSILYDRAQDTTNPDDGTTTTDSEASSGVPTWTWGVIGAVVVVAFIVGAFILSRGEGEGDDDKEWDY